MRILVPKGICLESGIAIVNTIMNFVPSVVCQIPTS